MKYLSLVYLATAVAASVVRRDLATITGVLSSVGADLDGINSAAKGFSGDPTALLDANNKAVADLKDGNAKVSPLPGLTLTDALGLTQPSKDLQTKGDALLAAIKDKKAAFAAAGMCEVTLMQVTDLKDASDALIKTVVSKVPAAAQSIAQGLVAPLQKALADAVDLFSPANCQNGGGNPTTQPTSAAPTTTAAPTSAAPTTTAAPTTVAPTTTKPATTVAPTTTKPATTSVPTVPATTSTGSIPTTTAPGPGNGTCPAASTVTVTSTDTKDCTPTPTCTKTPPVTVTATTKACPTGSKLPW